MTPNGHTLLHLDLNQFRTKDLNPTLFIEVIISMESRPGLSTSPAVVCQFLLTLTNDAFQISWPLGVGQGYYL